MTTPTQQNWLSSSLRHLRIPAGAAQRVPVIVPTLAWEQDVCQEPLVWFGDGRWHMLYTGGWDNHALGYATCDGDPLTPTNWVKKPAPTLGQGAAGFAGGVAHPGFYIEGSTLYLYFTDFLASPPVLRVATTPLSADPPTWTLGGTVFDLPTGLAGDGWIANTYVVHDTTQDHPYTLFYENQSEGWQLGVAVGDSPTGPFTSITTQLRSPKPFVGAGCSNPWLGLENGEYVMYFHGTVAGPGLPSQIYRAHTRRENLTTDAWKLDNHGRPVIRRAHTYETEQVADICLARAGTDTPRVGFWSGLDNAKPLGAIMAAPMLPTLLMWDGIAWVDQTGGDDPTPRMTQAQQPITAELTTDATVSGAAQAILTATITPVGTSVQVDFAGFASNTSAGAHTSLGVKIDSQVKALGRITQGAAGAQFPLSGKTKFTGLTPGQQVTVELQAATSAGTFQCRPAGQPGVEGCALTVQDAAYWPSPD